MRRVSAEPARAGKPPDGRPAPRSRGRRESFRAGSGPLTSATTGRALRAAEREVAELRDALVSARAAPRRAPRTDAEARHRIEIRQLETALSIAKQELAAARRSGAALAAPTGAERSGTLVSAAVTGAIVGALATLGAIAAMVLLVVLR